MSDTRKDSLECNILKEMRTQLIDKNRWTKASLFTGEVSGEISETGYDDDDDPVVRWMPWDGEEAIDSNEKVLTVGRSLVQDPSTPAEALELLTLYDEDEGESTVRAIKVEEGTLEVCLVGAAYLCAGMNGVENPRRVELVQVMVATGRAVMRHSRDKNHLDALPADSVNESLPYTSAGMEQAESMIISFNDNEETTADDIDAVLTLADIELACIREAVPA